jgi:catechol 2,3-dioxygenase
MQGIIMSKAASPSGVTIGHVHLRVSDLERSISFYKDVIGLTITTRYGDEAAFMSFDGYHHHLGLNTWASKGGAPAPAGHPGLFHVAFLYPDRAALGTAIKRVADAGVVLTGAADHGVSEAVYLDDPDGNGIELYRDRPKAEWKYNDDGSLVLMNERLDVAGIVGNST